MDFLHYERLRREAIREEQAEHGCGSEEILDNSDEHVRCQSIVAQHHQLLRHSHHGP